MKIRRAIKLKARFLSINEASIIKHLKVQHFVNLPDIFDEVEKVDIFDIFRI